MIIFPAVAGIPIPNMSLNDVNVDDVLRNIAELIESLSFEEVAHSFNSHR